MLVCEIFFNILIDIGLFGDCVGLWWILVSSFFMLGIYVYVYGGYWFGSIIWSDVLFY